MCSKLLDDFAYFGAFPLLDKSSVFFISILPEIPLTSRDSTLDSEYHQWFSFLSLCKDIIVQVSAALTGCPTLPLLRLCGHGAF